MNYKLFNTLVPVPRGLLQIPDSPKLDNSSDLDLIRLSLVIPTYQESQNIQKLVEILSQLLDSIIPGEYELIVVDDNSPDRTWKLAQELTPAYPQLRVMRRVEEKGLSTAVIRGWQTAKGEILGVIDADLQHPPEVLLQLWQEVEQGADLAVASRHVDGGGVSEWSLMRRILSRGAQMLGLIILPEVLGRLSDPMSGYFLLRRSCMVYRCLSPIGYKILIEVVARGRIRSIAEVGYVFQERQEGESKVSWKQYFEYIRHLLKLRLSLWSAGRFVRFGMVGLTGVLVDMGILFLLSDPTTLGLSLTSSKIVAAEVAIINNFWWNDLWTFRDIAQKQKGIRQRYQRLLKFNVICLCGLILNVLLLNIFFNVLHINRYAANLMAIAAITVWNFWFNCKFSWRVTDTHK